MPAQKTAGTVDGLRGDEGGEKHIVRILNSRRNELKQSKKDHVKSELENLKKLASTITVKELKEGLWFSKLLKHALSSYTEKVDAAYFTEKYPNLPRDGIVDRRVALAKKYTAIAGGLNAGAYSAAVLTTIGSAGGASPLMVPAAVTSFTADILYTSMMQLRLAYDLSVLYEYPIDIDDPSDLIDLIKIAFGIKTGETLTNAAIKIAPEATRVGVKTMISGSRLATLKALPVIGKHLLQRNLIKFAIPAVAIPLSSGINYKSTSAIAKTAKRIYRRRAVLREEAQRISVELLAIPLLTLQLIYLVARETGEVSENQAVFIRELGSLFSEDDKAALAVKQFEAMVHVSEPKVLEQVANQPSDVKKRLFDVAVITAASNANIHKLEKKLLMTVAEACDCEYDTATIKRMVKQFS